MTPPLSLRYRLDQRSSGMAFHRKRTRPSADPYQRFSTLSQDAAAADDAVQLLLSISNTVTKEIENDAHILDYDDSDMSQEGSSSQCHDSIQENLFLTPRNSDVEDAKLSRARTVSFDYSPQAYSLLPPDFEHKDDRSSPFSLGTAALVSPAGTPIGRGRPVRRASLKLSQKAKRQRLNAPKVPQLPPVNIDVQQYKRKAVEAASQKGISVKIIGRKKFSWKNYPELEEFLVANRDEYLRHSALNYTVQQKVYNNKLTEQLLEIAADHAYVFNDKEFSFVTVRDRIRCYFKSYVQSAKKRGITVGYAARKAGLLTDDDLRVEQEGQIVVPSGI